MVGNHNGDDGLAHEFGVQRVEDLPTETGRDLYDSAFTGPLDYEAPGILVLVPLDELTPDSTKRSVGRRLLSDDLTAVERFPDPRDDAGGAVVKFTDRRCGSASVTFFRADEDVSLYTQETCKRVVYEYWVVTHYDEGMGLEPHEHKFLEQACLFDESGAARPQEVVEFLDSYQNWIGDAFD